MNDLFERKELNDGRPEGIGWHREAFSRAYCGPRGPFTRVRDRLNRGFSVLVYLPGNCMAAAAEYVKNGVEWKEYGKHPGKGGIQEVWEGTADMVKQMADWLRGNSGGNANAIYHNLNLLSDGRGGLHGSPEAQTALFSLTEATRAGVVLALSSAEAGKLPEPIEQVFAEKVWIDEIAPEAFRSLIPRKLGERLKEPDGGLADGTAWLLASRLRWTDPIRAVNLMESVAKTLGNCRTPQEALQEALDQIWWATRAVGFIDPDGSFPEQITGFEPETLDRLREEVAGPFLKWRGFTGTREACERILRRLPPGLILHGPPGTGKTYLARWLASSIRLPVRVVDATHVKDPLFGRAEENVHRLFREARRAAPCMLVLDDADDLLPDRSRAEGGLASTERAIVNAFLQELEGFEGRPAGVLVVMTTNRFENLDRAVCSRLEIKVRIPFPLDQDQILEIVRATARQEGLKLSSEVESALAERFFRTIHPDPTAQIATPAERKRCEENLFSAREIQQAMRRLVRATVGEERYHADGTYVPDAADVERMKRYYEPREALSGGE